MKNKLGKALMANDSFPGLFEQQSSIQFLRLIGQDKIWMKV